MCTLAHIFIIKVGIATATIRKMFGYNEMKKIDLITGFLGSGKTTFLKKYVKYLISQGEKVCILENDFGAVNVDMMLLSELRSENCELEMVAGGCDADCHKRRFKTKLISMGMDDYTRIVVEPSGIFDVDEFFDCLYDEPLNRWYEIGSVIAIVDGGLEESLSDNSKYMLASQVACAGKVIISKSQNYTKDQIDSVKVTLKKSLNLVNCERDLEDCFVDRPWGELGDYDFRTISNAGRVRADYVKKLSDSGDYEAISFLEPGRNLVEIKETINRLMNASECKIEFGDIFRIKGFVSENGRWHEINATKEKVSINEISEGQEVIIVIGEKLNKERIKALIEC